MLTVTSASSYINNIRQDQSTEQMESMELRARGVNFDQKISDFCPYFIYILEINQFCTVISDFERDQMIDYLIN